MESDKKEKENQKRKEAKVVALFKEQPINPLDNLLKDLEDISKDIEQHFAEDPIASELPANIEEQSLDPDSEKPILPENNSEPV